MSAYMVNRADIALLVSGRLLCGQHDHLRWFRNGAWGECQTGDYEAAERLGQALWDENVRSVEARYPDTVGHPERRPGPIGESYIFQHRSSADHRPNPVAVLRACDHYEYQSCEHEGWEASEAYAVVQALRSAAIHALPGYDAQPWGQPDADARAEVAPGVAR